jgi:multidrug resistance efflux pump
MDLDVFEAFRAAGVPDDKARGAVEAINGLIDRRYALHAEQLATRGDVAGVRAEIAGVRAEVAGVRAEVADVRAELRTEIAGVRAELRSEIAGVRTEIADAKSELIRWCVGSIFSAVGAFAAITKLLTH